MDQESKYHDEETFDFDAYVAKKKAKAEVSLIFPYFENCINYM